MYQYAELVHWMKNKDTMQILPAQVDIDLTNICDQDCFYCNSADFRAEYPVQKKYTEYITLIDQLATWREHTPKSYGSLHTITYPGGGEPTLLKGYEKVLEYTIDSGFLTSITTNGSHLENLVENVSVEKIRKMGWIGVDIDAGTEDLYEKIRKSKTAGTFDRVMTNIKNLTDMQANVDVKILLNEHNSNLEALHDIFKLAQKLNVRMVYFRPILLDNYIFPMETITPILDKLSQDYQVKIMYNIKKTVPRTYKKCHQMFNFPVFCADGKIYLCCDYKGDSRFYLCNWDRDDFRDQWLGPRHHEIYNSINTAFCPPCRSNHHNNSIQDILNNPIKIENLYL